MRPSRILVVEDDPDQREALGELLRMHGHTVLLVPNGLEALKQLRSGSELPDVILLDLSMPVMGGLEFLNQRRRYPELEQVEVIILTGDHFSDSVVVLPDAPVLLRKPVTVEELLEMVGWVTAERPSRRSTASFSNGGTSHLSRSDSATEPDQKRVRVAADRRERRQNNRRLGSWS